MGYQFPTSVLNKAKKPNNYIGATTDSNSGTVAPRPVSRTMPSVVSQARTNLQPRGTSPVADATRGAMDALKDTAARGKAMQFRTMTGDKDALKEMGNQMKSQLRQRAGLGGGGSNY